jgi:hypothetical protein
MIEINSLSAFLMLKLTLYRNQASYCNKILAQIGYALITLIAICESIVSFVLNMVTLGGCCEWYSSSIFCIIWSITDFCMNPFVNVLVADEISARQIAASDRGVMYFPDTAII